MTQIAVTIDTETYPDVFLLVARICDSDLTFIFEISPYQNDSESLYMFLCWLRDSHARCYGFNLLGFDGPLIHMFMQMGGKTTARTLYEKAQAIIESQDEDKFAHMVRPTDRPFEWVCLYRLHHFNNRARSTSLKMLEFVMRMDNIQDLPFKVGSSLDRDQIAQLRAYCVHDVKATELFRVKSKEMIKLREQLGVKYNRDFLNHDDVKIGSAIFEIALEHAGVHLYDFGSKGRTPRQTRRASIYLGDIVLPHIQFEQPEFTRVLEWLKSQTITETKGIFEDVIARVNGFDFVFGLGGIHGSVESEIIESDGEYVVESIDVSSYYPNLAIVNRFYPEHLGDMFCDVYRELYEQRKKTVTGSPENAALKLALNGTFGKSNDMFSPFYDPALMLKITINGQLLLCMLAEQLMKVPTLQIKMINTDGIEYRVRRDYVNHSNQICDWWQSFTRLTLEGARYKRLFVINVNNYLGEFEDGKIKRKGAFEYNLGFHQNHGVLLVAKAAEKYLINDAPIRETVEQWPDIMDFMLRTKVPRSGRLTIEKDGEHQQIQNITRYYVAKGGGHLFKWLPPLKGKTEWRKFAIESGWGVQVCNDISDAGELPVDFDYYVNEIEKLTLGMT